MDTKHRDRDFIGQGLAFPLQANPRGDLTLAAGTNNIEQSIKIILSTVPGERVMRPTFGCRAWELVFDPNDASTQVLMADYVREALAMWEPRILVQQVNAFRDREHLEALLVDVRYEVKATHDPRSIVFPFFISEEA